MKFVLTISRAAGWGETMGGLMPRLHAPQCACVLLTVDVGDATVHTGDDYERHRWQCTTSLSPVHKIAWIKVTLEHGLYSSIELLSVVLALRERGYVGTMLRNKVVLVISWQHCHNKHTGFKKICRENCVMHTHT
jgi:hypothetical protein